MIDEITRAALDEVIETGRIDFVDDLADIVPAVLTMSMLDLPMNDYMTYVEPIHAQVYTKPGTPEMTRVDKQMVDMAMRSFGYISEIRANPRPGLINALINAASSTRSPTTWPCSAHRTCSSAAASTPPRHSPRTRSSGSASTPTSASD